MTADLIAFLNARLDEDEALARQAAQVAGLDWTFKTEVPEGCDYPTDYITSPDGALLLDTMGGIEGDAPHVARHDPARVLREVAFKRHILESHYPRRPWAPDAPDGLLICAGEEADGDTWQMATRWPCPDVRALAAVWSDHPDYDPEWKLRPAAASPARSHGG